MPFSTCCCSSFFFSFSFRCCHFPLKYKEPICRSDLPCMYPLDVLDVQTLFSVQRFMLIQCSHWAFLKTCSENPNGKLSRNTCWNTYIIGRRMGKIAAHAIKPGRMSTHKSFLTKIEIRLSVLATFELVLQIRYGFASQSTRWMMQECNSMPKLRWIAVVNGNG